MEDRTMTEENRFSYPTGLTWNQFREDFLRRISSLYPEQESLSLFYWGVSEICGWNRSGLVRYLNESVPVHILVRFQEYESRLLTHEPVQYIFGKAYFAHVELTVNSSVLIPRPETEELWWWACTYLRSLIKSGHRKESELRVLDLCTGSGAIAIALSKEFSKAEVYACDISGPALSIAEENNVANGTSVVFFQQDILVSDRWNCPGTASIRQVSDFDLVISNPPYIRPSEKILMRKNVLDYEPSEALFVNEADPLLFYRAVATIAKDQLRKGGCCMVEINEAFPQQTADLFSVQGFDGIEIRTDMQGKFRMIKACK